MKKTEEHIDFYKIETNVKEDSLDLNDTFSETLIVAERNIKINSIHNLKNMSMDKNIKALKVELDKIIEDKNYKIKDIYEKHLKNKSIIFLKNIKHNLTGKNIKAYDIIIKATEIYVIEEYLLIYDKKILCIYKWNTKLEIKKIREIRTHTLLYHIKTENINRNIKNVFYNIILTLISQKIKRIDVIIENILNYLEIDELCDMKLQGNYLICYYKNGNKKFYDNTLKNIEEYEQKNFRGKNLGLKYDDLEIKIGENRIEIDYHEKNYLEIIDIPFIRESFYFGEYLFVLTEEHIKILHFFNN